MPSSRSRRKDAKRARSQKKIFSLIGSQRKHIKPDMPLIFNWEFFWENTNVFNKINSPLITYYNTGESFLSNLPMAYLTEILRTYEKIVDSNNGINAYEKLKNISYLKKY